MPPATTRQKDHYIVCAYGRVGRTVARELEAEGHPFIVIERRQDLEHQMISDGVRYLVGDPTSEVLLRSAGIARARALITCVDSDADNVYITLTARALNADLFIVARASDPKTRHRLTHAGADRIVSPYVSSGTHMAMLALRPRIVDYLEIVGHDERTLRFEELEVERGSPLEGATVADVTGGLRPLVIRRADGSVLAQPAGGERVRGGDLIVLLGAS